MVHSVTLEGKKVVLRPITMNDVNDEYVSWLNDDDVIGGLETVVKPYTHEMLADYIAAVLTDEKAYMFMVLDAKTGKSIGTTKLHNISKRHGTCNLGAIIGDKSYWGGGYGPDILSTVIDFAFTQLKIRKITESVYSNNPRALLMDLKLGFTVEGVLKKQININGEYVDKIMIALFADNWKK